MDTKTLLYLLIGTVLMIGVMFCCRKKYGLPIGKGLLSSVLLTVIGVASVKLMFFVENGNFSGLSFFGAVFFLPLFAFPVALLLRIPYTDYLDISAPSVAAMLSVMKINCLVSGCCRGKVLYSNGAGAEVRFPSQIFEMICAFLIAVALVWLLRKDMLYHRAFPFFMVLYGTTRFVLNFFRETQEIIWGMAIGNLWAILAVAAGGVWLYLFYRREKRSAPQTQTQTK